MPIDTTPSTVATNALQAIPFKALIGGPLQACVEAQAHAANTTWNFIKEVGLNPQDPHGNRSATTVVFQYQKGGEMVNLVVPLLAIVPIPFLAVDDVTIHFKANISAASSSVATQRESTAASGSVGGAVRAGWGPFGFQANFNANYSSKKDSRATQDSKYSVEYTMDIHVHAGQADMPAGLSRVLNLLESAMTEGNPGGSLEASPALGFLDAAQPQVTQDLLLVVKDGGGLFVKGQPVTLSMDGAHSKAFSLTVTRGKETEGWSNGKITVHTDAKGQAGVRIAVASNQAPPSNAGIKIEAKVKNGTKEEAHEEKVMLQIANATGTSSAQPSLTPELDTLKVKKNVDKLLNVTAKTAQGEPASGVDITFTIDQDAKNYKVTKAEGEGNPSWDSNNGAIKLKTNTKGVAAINVMLTADSTTASKFSVSGSINGKSITEDVKLELET